jgi:hypothetical protein
MHKFQLVLVVAGVLSMVGLFPDRAVVAQQPTCLHGPNESPAEQMRRRQALRLARQINSAQVVARQRTNAYQPLSGLANVDAAPDGFAARVVVEPNGYVFSIKDSTDPCGFSFFSDQEGTIYTGEALR